MSQKLRRDQLQGDLEDDLPAFRHDLRSRRLVVGLSACALASVFVILSRLGHGALHQVALTAASVAVGAGLGAALPSTRAILFDTFRRPTRTTILERRSDGNGGVIVRVRDPAPQQHGR
jgi:MFS family permease